MNWTILKKRDFTPAVYLKIFFALAVSLTAAMAVVSNYDRHPDEHFHFEAVKYYVNHFLPPEIDDPAVRDSYSVYGVSYLNYHWAEYFFAGKFVYLLSPFVENPFYAARFFQVFLFAGLFLWFAFRGENYEFIIPCFLLATPQVWYVFSYVNNDAFALFIALLAADQIARPKSLLNEFLSEEPPKNRIRGGIFFGILTGFLLIVKPNYWSFLIFAALWIIFKYPPNVRNLKRFALILLVAFGVLIFRVGLDFYVNGETNYVGFSYVHKFFGNLENKGKLATYQESVAEYRFRSSTVENDPENAFPEIKMRQRGVGFFEMLFEKKWLEMSWKSFVGAYGYMNIWSSKRYYTQIFALHLIFAVFLIYAVVKSREKESLIQLGLMFFGCFLTVFVSMMLSWLYAFQPQGRYLFPVLPMLGLFVYANRRHFNNFAINAFLIAAFLLSCYSFVLFGLKKINIPL